MDDGPIRFHSPWKTEVESGMNGNIEQTDTPEYAGVKAIVGPGSTQEAEFGRRDLRIKLWFSKEGGSLEEVEIPKGRDMPSYRAFQDQQNQDQIDEDTLRGADGRGFLFLGLEIITYQQGKIH